MAGKKDTEAKEKARSYLSKDLVRCIKSHTSFLYFVTPEEDRFLRQLFDAMPERQDQMHVYNSTMGLIKLREYFDDLTTRKHKQEASTVMFANAMKAIYGTETSPRNPQFFFILDPESCIKDAHGVREVMNVIHQTHQDVFSGKFVIFVSNRKFVPEKLQRYIEVIFDKGLSDQELHDLVESTCQNFKMPCPTEISTLFRGMISYEIKQAISRSVALTKKDGSGHYVDPQIITDYRRKQFHKSDLIQYVDSSEYSFDRVGGLPRFKSWAQRNAHGWTKEGQEFGLKPPRGVLLVGVYGCGKSLAVKSLANSWNLPLVQFDMGRLRSSGVGDTESNVYKALQIIESASPCLVWVDEAEKGFAGSESSGASDSGTTARALGILSTWIQENKSPVCIAMTANSLKGLPPELVNRMTERFFVDLPDEEDRIDILKIHMKALNQDPSKFNLAILAEKAQGMVGREIEQALEASMVESYVAKKAGLDEEILANELIRKPRIVKTMSDQIQEIVDWVGYDEDVDDGIRARLASNHRNESLKFIPTK